MAKCRLGIKHFMFSLFITFYLNLCFSKKEIMEWDGNINWFSLHKSAKEINYSLLMCHLNHLITAVRFLLDPKHNIYWLIKDKIIIAQWIQSSTNNRSFCDTSDLRSRADPPLRVECDVYLSIPLDSLGCCFLHALILRLRHNDEKKRDRSIKQYWTIALWIIIQ